MKKILVILFIGLLLGLIISTDSNAGSILIGGPEGFEGTVADIHSRWPARNTEVQPDGSNSAAMSLSTQFSFAGTNNLRMNFCGSQIADGGHPVCSGGAIEREFTAPSQDNWTTVTIYWEPGFQVSGSHDGRLPCNNQPLWTCGSGLKWGPYMRGAGNQLLSWMFGSREISSHCQGCWDAHLPGQSKPNYETWHLPQNQGNNFSMPDGHHVCYEHHIKVNDYGVANGVQEVWVTDLSVPGFVPRRIIYYTGMEIIGPTPQGWNDRMWGIQLYRQDSIGVAHYDNFDVTDVRKGCTGTPPTDTTNPPTVPVPTGTPTSTTSITWTWPTVSDASGILNYIADLCQGDGCVNFVQVGTPTTNSLVTPNLLPNTKYYLRLKAKDGVNLESTNWSVAGSATTLANPPPTTSFYISPTGSDANLGTIGAPFLTINRARTAVQAIRSSMTADITVYLRGGTYYLTSTQQFSNADGGLNGFKVIYKSYTGEKAHISGGRVITGWTNIGNGLWRAPSQGLQFRQLYVNNTRAIRARTPNDESYKQVRLWVGPDSGVNPGADKYILLDACDFPGCVPPTWNNLSKVEMYTSREWLMNIMRVSSIVTQGTQIRVNFQSNDTNIGWLIFCVLREPNDQGSNCYNPGSGSHRSYYFFENALEFLDSPGEFYLDEVAQHITYMPRAGEDMTTATVVAPVLERVANIAGVLGNKVDRLEFHGLIFEHSTWNYPSNNGFSGVQASSYIVYPYQNFPIPAMIHTEYVDRIRFERNRFQFSGAGALYFDRGTQFVDVIGNVFRETSGAGLMGYGWGSSNNTITTNVVGNINIRNNWFKRTSLDIFTAAAIDLQYMSPLDISNNEIDDVGYSGIAMQWKSWPTNPNTINISIRRNYVHHTNKKISDGGGIYTFEVKYPNTIIQDNLVHDILRGSFAGVFPTAGIYLDQQTDWVNASNNVIRNSSILFHTNFFAAPQDSLNNVTGPNPTSSALIEASAGIQAEYIDIKTLDDVPPPPIDTQAPIKPSGLYVE